VRGIVIKRIRRISEEEVIAIFLRGEFHYPEFDCDRERFTTVVNDLARSGRDEGDVRRNLLFRRRGHVWRELPSDTQWWEVEVEAEDVRKMNVFTRGHWMRMDRKDHSVPTFAEGMRSPRVSRIPAVEAAKIFSLQQRIGEGLAGNDTILLVGIDEQQPTTILEGNKRVVAAYMADSGSVASRFRFLLGISSEMAKCIFYEHTAANFWNYLWHRLAYAIQHPSRGFSRPANFLENETYR
jgi:hypothetical protein